MRLRWFLAALAVSLSAFGRQPVHAPEAMVVTQEANATDVGVAVLKSGGNAVDAAVAVGFALAATYPAAGNIGGGGFMLVRMADGRTTFLDFREKAPAKAGHDMYLGPDGQPTKDSLVGPRAAGVPGTVRGLELAHKKFGTRPWAELVQPAAKLAGEGFPLGWAAANSLARNDLLSQFPESKRVFQRDGKYYAQGDSLRQPELAATLNRIARSGARDFYEGQTAGLLADFMAAQGGLITREDLKSYRAVERAPLLGRYKGYAIITAPPPSAGGVALLQMLGMVEDSGYEKTGAGSAAAIHYVAEAMRRAYADRSQFLGDPDFTKVPVTSLLEKSYLAKRRETINREKAGDSKAVQPGPLAKAESAETTHYSVVDATGNAVAVTYTLNGGYGCGATVPGAGFLLNNEMDDFAAKPGVPNLFGLVQGEANAIQPNKRPLSSMVPTIVLKEDRPFLVLGAPGGSRIPNGVLEVLLNVVDFGMNVQEAVDQPRFHHQWLPDKLFLERGISPDTEALLRAKGHDVVPDGGGVAQVQAVLMGATDKQGAYDGRGGGKAAGY